VAERLLITGVQGCLGAWAARAALDAGHFVVGFDQGSNLDRLRLTLGGELGKIELTHGDITDRETIDRALDEYEISRVLHLAALQVPACREDPARGALVNVVGTVNVLEAVKDRRDRIPGLAYASSAAVYGPDEPPPASERVTPRPATAYGVYKLANEGSARIAWQDAGVASIGIRPYVVYGPGRDQGLTSGPTHAMAAAARGEPYRIGFGGACQYDYAPDVGVAFVRAALAVQQGAVVANYPGVVATTAEIVALIEAASPSSRDMIEWADQPLPFPAELGALPRTPLADGVAATIAAFKR
jgi:nucleoside-diphosphate-sugar epimerase